MNRLKGKVALVTGAARGQGRSHAVQMADEGADIVLIDVCADIPSNGYPLATVEDLDETVKLVEKSGRRVASGIVDVRDRAALKEFVDTAVAEMGGLDIVVANAAICPLGNDVPQQGFVDAFDVNFIGVVNTVHLAVPHLGRGGSVIVTGSVAGLVPTTGVMSGHGLTGPGGAGYGLAKRLLCEYVKSLAMTLGTNMIRVNLMHPTNVNTDMLHNEPMYRTFRPDLPNPTREDAEVTFPFMQVLPVPYVEVEDISHAVVFLASDESRYVTGQELYIDAGAALKLGI
ncbi:mycofactocin-coupled SDR family oxidoreductase [Mycobacterium sp. E2479]|uniref:mycofactocin-coupled SDR family oxidoreductase n=1 Tax=Mycobacterium sp. E2479 TaxID=1834134 RepID=UPI00080113B6|nr:mycofactocin-coupled SDR family oxidoreductase [Mycobacterium sp. E2479]OBH49249.1 3-ketoacyl-ACP reductase [Mycobacterium sp. E2479]